MNWENDLSEFGLYDDNKKPLRKEKRKKDNVLIVAKHSVDPHQYKNNILTALFNCGVLQTKINAMMYRYKVGKDTQLIDDCIQVIFLELSKKDPAYIIERYEKDHTILIGLAVRIAVWKVFAKPKDEAIKNHSLIHTLYTFSNLGISSLSDEYNVLDYLTDDEIDYTEQYPDLSDKLSIKSQETFNDFILKMKKLPKSKQDFDTVFYSKRTNRHDLINMIQEVLNHNKTEKEIRMNKEEIYNEIECIKPLLDEYLVTKNIKHLDVEKIETIKKVWRMVNPASNANSLSSCGTCLKDSLDILISFHDRLKKQLDKEAKEVENKTDENVSMITFESPLVRIEKAEEALVKSKEKRAAERKAARIKKKDGNA